MALIPPISLRLSERIFEDHENLVENLLNWTRDSHNKLMFIERIEKYALFKNPQVTAPHTQTHRQIVFPTPLRIRCTHTNVLFMHAQWLYSPESEQGSVFVLGGLQVGQSFRVSKR